MAIINGVAGFTQLTKLNIIDTLLVDGKPLDPTAEDIIEVSANYQVLVTDDIIVATGTLTVTLPLLSNADKKVAIKSISGTVTVDGNGSTVEAPVSLTAGQANTYVPVSTGWVQI